MNKLSIFQGKRIRKAWHNNEWYFSVVDVVGILTDSANPTDYFKKLRKRDLELASYVGTNCPQVEMLTEKRKKRKTLSANTEQIFRIIQSIPSPKAEPFKIWLAKVGYERIEEIKDPELAFNRAIQNYYKKGCSKEWINQRLKTIEIRKELTDEWKERGLKEGVEFAILTDEIIKAWSGRTVKEYKKVKGLKSESLRDNMTNLEVVLNMLAEVTTTEILKGRNSRGFNKLKKDAKDGGNVAGRTKKDIEAQSGK